MANLVTLIDYAKRTGNNSAIGIVESLTQANPVFDMIGVKPIKGTSYRYGQRTSLGNVDFVGYNQGVARSKSGIRQVTVETKLMKGFSEVDKVLAEDAIEGVKAFRSVEDESFLVAMANKFNSKAYYGNSSTGYAEFDGIATLLNALNPVGTGNGYDNVVSASGSTSNAETSMYFWSFKPAMTKQGKLPGAEMPLANGKLPTAFDIGLQMTLDADGNKFAAYTTVFEMQPGLAIYDLRSVGRLCNIDSTHKPTADLINRVITGMFPYYPDLITCSKATYNYLQGIKTVSGANFYIPNELRNKDLFTRASFFDQIPIMIDENITQTEAVVS